MSIDPGVVDTNILIYGLSADSPHHEAARRILREAQAAAGTFCVTSQILCEFYAVVTNPRRVAQPRSAEDAAAAVAGFLSFLRVLPAPAHTAEIWLHLLQRRRVTGGDIFDLQLAATMLANGVNRVYTFNAKDFEVFPELAVETP